MKLLLAGVICWLLSFISRASDMILPPCNQLEEMKYQELCTEFLKDPENTGGMSFSRATATDNPADFRHLLEEEKQAATIIMLTDSIQLNLTKAIVPVGKVAIVGNPKASPKITILYNEKAGFIITLSHYPDPTKTASQFFACWGVYWVQENNKSYLSYLIVVDKRYGEVRVTNNGFAHHARFNKKYAPLYWLFVQVENVHYYPVHSHVYIINNHFMTWPFQASAGIIASCEPQNVNSCVNTGDLVIKNNVWEKTEYEAPEPNPGPFTENYNVIFLNNVPKAQIIGNRVADLSVYAPIYIYFVDSAELKINFTQLDLLIAGNTASHDIDTPYRTLLLQSGQLDIITPTPQPVAGKVNISWNNCYEIALAGGFVFPWSKNLNLTIENNGCHNEENITSATMITVPVPSSSAVTPASDSTVIASSIMSIVSESIQPTSSSDATSSMPFPVIISASVLPSASPEAHGHDSIDFKPFIYAFGGVIGVVALVTTWQVLWNVVYRHSTGKFQKVVNIMAFFIPYCINHLIKSREGSEEALLPDFAAEN